MSIITNEMGLPEEFYNACKHDEYVVEDGIYSATTLLKDPKEIILARRHADEIVIDCADLCYSILGTATHSVLSSSKESDDEFKEERVYLDVVGGRISGQFDLYNVTEKRLKDYKVTSVWQYMVGDTKKYRMQLLIYAYILRKIGFECDSGQIVQIYRDYSKTKAKTTAGYPRRPAGTIDFKFTEDDFKFIEKYINDKIADINKYKDMEDDDIPECCKENRWATDDKFAVKKTGRKTALRVLDSMKDATSWMEENGDKNCYVEERPAESRKCINYCDCKDFCNFYKKNYGDKGV